MFDFDFFLEIGGTMRRNALRTVLTAVGVFWGVLLLLVMMGFGNGLEAGARSSMSGLVTNSIYIWGQRTSVPYLGQGPGRYVRLTLDDAVALEGIDGVDLVAPRVSLGGRRGSQAVTRGTKSEAFEVMGDTPGYLRLQPMRIHGRFINQLDMKQRRKVAVIGSRVAEVLFARGEEPVGAAIQIKGVEFMVVGVFDTLQSGERGAQHAATVYTPLTTFQKVLSTEPFIHYLAVLSKDGTKAGVVGERLKEVLRKRHRVSPADQMAVNSFDADAEVRKLDNLFLGISLLIYVVGSATLVAGLVGVSNIMMVSVRERTREIGIRKAIGATPRAVIWQIVMESTLLSSAAGYFGLVAGVGLLELVGLVMGTSDGSEPTMFAPPQVTLASAVVAAVAVAIGGAVAGFFPARHAAAIHTVTALHHE